MTDTYPIYDLSRPTTFEIDMPWQDAAFVSLADATDWLDYLENQGVKEYALVLVGDEFHVRWR